MPPFAEPADAPCLPLRLVRAQDAERRAERLPAAERVLVGAWALADEQRPGRPVGGEAQALRALFAMLAARYGNARP